ncbi:3' terminal RNA ribose 2'-O-methyltransferase Hen1 [Streptomyces sp. CSDS2]|uniref:3' terminal RNA ribose 2'-O-methyltransferase Hen1 n=1 Tax=Streptomyces sp. CSDS2 TaxID=3055051 RepID=UPI0025B010A6|nr:3' terminal RNA ribose 2'-O-methyltransferase Hen1 [Streptomyces sp. CSDS2]MDN3258923.1 3' terminal RNA ribose 2'-O-methyltransferase Hen1 [Streptomyces sp. CSDS2]
MFVTISTTGTAARPATDLGYLLHKHPDKAQAFSTSYGTAHVFYPEADAERCTAALLLEIDPVALVRRGRGKGRGGAPDAALAQYVNDRPYAASSLLAVALGNVFSSALRGVCDARPERAATPLPLRVEVPALPARGGPDLVRRLFAPLGWSVTADPVPLDTTFPQWGDSRYVRLVLESERLTLAEALRHLYVLLPVLDDAKHYWVSADEVGKLLRVGEGWLAGHPEQQLITSRYLSRRWSLTRQARERLELVRLAEADDSDVEDIDNAVADEPGTEDIDNVAADETGAEDIGKAVADEPGTERIDDAAADKTGSEAGSEAGTGGKPTPLAVLRREAVLAALDASGAARVLDLGCGQGQLVQALLKDARFTEIVGVDVSQRALTVASRRLKLDRMGERQAARVRLVQGSLVYTDQRLRGYDAAVLSEVVEHVDPPRLPALEYAVFGHARPRTVVVTTPNAEYNVRWESLPAGHVRHRDHRFEWTREEFRTWAAAVAERYGYEAAFTSVGPDDPEVGPPTQMATFTIMTEREAKAA